jgi:hypothetical protein
MVSSWGEMKEESAQNAGFQKGSKQSAPNAANKADTTPAHHPK